MTRCLCLRAGYHPLLSPARPILPNIETYLLEDVKQCNYVLDHLDQVSGQSSG